MLLSSEANVFPFGCQLYAVWDPFNGTSAKSLNVLALFQMYDSMVQPALSSDAFRSGYVLVSHVTDFLGRNTKCYKGFFFPHGNPRSSIQTDILKWCLQVGSREDNLETM